MDNYLKEKIQKVQNLCIHFIFDLKRKDHCNYSSYRKQLKWLDMNLRRLKHGFTLIYKILHGLAPNYLCDTFTLVNQMHNVNTRRSSNDIWINKSSTSKLHRKSYTFEMANLYNQIPEDIKNCISVNSFKKRIGEFLYTNTLAYS